MVLISNYSQLLFVFKVNPVFIEYIRIKLISAVQYERYTAQMEILYQAYGNKLESTKQ